MRLSKRIVLPILILAAGFVVVQVLVRTRPRVEARAPEAVMPVVRAVVATPSRERVSVRTQGTVVPRTESHLIPQIAGEVVWVSPNLVSGGFFEKDEPLVRLDRADAAVELQSARAAVARAESEAERAETELTRQRQLRERGVASQARIDDAENAQRVTEAALREARARASRAARDLARTELRAPFPGRVRSKQVDVGQFVSRGAAIATLYAVDQAEVRLPLPDRELRWLDLPLGYAGRDLDGAGPEVRLHAEFAGEPRSWSGRIVRTEGEIDPKSRMVNVVARVDDPYGREGATAGWAPLAVGLFVEAEILGRQLDDVFRLPRTVMQPDESGRDRVHVIGADGRLQLRDVTVLRRGREHVLIGEGLSEGERVSVSALPAVVDGMAVRVAGDRSGGVASGGAGSEPDERAPASGADPSPHS